MMFPAVCRENKVSAIRPKFRSNRICLKKPASDKLLIVSHVWFRFLMFSEIVYGTRFSIALRCFDSQEIEWRLIVKRPIYWWSYSRRIILPPSLSPSPTSYVKPILWGGIQSSMQSGSWVITVELALYRSCQVYASPTARRGGYCTWGFYPDFTRVPRGSAARWASPCCAPQT